MEPPTTHFEELGCGYGYDARFGWRRRCSALSPLLGLVHFRGKMPLPQFRLSTTAFGQS
ncbi:MAG: hypothetical protein JRI89_15215 [Deltaproteobacteria bacterium]|nr:hypothetical protein [Deltaproteobacteria bacterium]